MKLYYSNFGLPRCGFRIGAFHAKLHDQLIYPYVNKCVGDKAGSCAD